MKSFAIKTHFVTNHVKPIFLLLGWALILLCVSPAISVAQVSINEDNSDPDASAILDIKSTDKGMLIPRMTAEERDGIPSPANGLLVYVTDESTFYYFDGLTWEEVGSGYEPTDTLAYDLPDCESIISIDNGSAFITTGSSQWQSFTPTLTGHICEVRAGIYTSKLDKGFVRIYKGEGTAGTVIYEGYVEDLVRPASGIFDTIPFPSKAVLLQKDSLYTVELEDTVNTFNWRRRNTNVYHGGRASAGGDFFIQIDVRQTDLYAWQDIMTFVIDDADKDSTNEYQDLSLNGTQLSISNGLGVDLSSAQDDLGDHVMDDELETNGNWISNDGANAGIYIDGNNEVGIGTSNPSASLDVRNSFRYVDNNQGTGKVLTSDGSGNATWQTPGYGQEILPCFSYSFNNPKLSVSQLQQQSGYFLRSFNNGVLWQSFTAPEEGYLMSVKIWTKGGSENFKGGVIKIYQDEGTTGAQLLSKNISAISGAGTIDLSSNNLLLTGGQKYTIYIQDVNGVWGWAASNLGGGGPYSGGRSSTIGGRDHKFQVYMAVCEAVELQAITVNDANPGHNLNQVDTLHFSDGTYLTSTVTNDNMGDHTAQQNLETNGNWISNDGNNEGIFIDKDGNVGIGTNDPKELLHLVGTSGEDGIKFPDGSVQTSAPPTTGILTIGPGDFTTQSGAGVTQGGSGGLGGAYLTSGSHQLLAPVNLPHGAKITDFDTHGYDLHNTNIKVSLVRSGFTSSSTSTVATNTSSTSSGYYKKETAVSLHQVDNASNTYFIKVELVGGSWHSAGQLAVKAVVIEYRMP